MQQKLVWQKATDRGYQREVTKRKPHNILVEGDEEVIYYLCSLPTVEAKDFPLPAKFKKQNTRVVIPGVGTYTILYMKGEGRQYKV